MKKILVLNSVFFLIGFFFVIPADSSIPNDKTYFVYFLCQNIVGWDNPFKDDQVLQICIKRNIFNSFSKNEIKYLGKILISRYKNKFPDCNEPGIYSKDKEDEIMFSVVCED